MVRRADGVALVREFPGDELPQRGAFVAQHSTDVVLFTIDSVLWRSDGTPPGTFELGEVAPVDSLDECASNGAQVGCPCETQEDCDATYTDAFDQEATLQCSSFTALNGDLSSECRSKRLTVDGSTAAAVRVDDATYVLATVSTTRDNVRVFARVAPDGESFGVAGLRARSFGGAIFSLSGSALFGIDNNFLFHLALPGSPTAQASAALVGPLQVRAFGELGAVVIDDNKVLLGDSSNSFVFDATEYTVTVLRNEVGFDTGELVQNGFNAVNFRHSYVYTRSILKQGELVVSDGKVTLRASHHIAPPPPLSLF